MLSYQRRERALSPDKTLVTMELEAYKTFLPALFYLASKNKTKQNKKKQHKSYPLLLNVKLKLSDNESTRLFS